jgi:hypothetical protein
MVNAAAEKVWVAVRICRSYHPLKERILSFTLKPRITPVIGRSLIRTFLAGATKDAAISSRALSKLRRKN